MKNKIPFLTRRDFIRGTVGATLGASVFGLQWPRGEARAAAPSLVTVVRDKNAMDAAKNIDIAVLEKMLNETLTRVTGQKNTKDAWLSLVKPNDVIGLVPTDHLNPTHDEVVDVVKNSLMDAGIPEDRIRDAQGPRNAKKCDALIAIPGLKAHWLTGIGTVLKNYIMYSGSPSSYHQSNSSKLGKSGTFRLSKARQNWFWWIRFIRSATRDRSRIQDTNGITMVSLPGPIRLPSKRFV
jgi:hypothetical protein